MNKLRFVILFCVAFIFSSCGWFSSNDSSDGIVGLWKSRDEKSDKPRSLVAIYEYKGKYYGRMLATYNDEGEIKDTILEQKEKAPGVVGEPPYCGMDFVYNLEEEKDAKDKTKKYKGKIIDPQKGKVYNVQVWREGDVLIVRGELWIFGKNIPWKKASKKDLPKGFSMSEIKKFVPVIPKVK